MGDSATAPIRPRDDLKVVPVEVVPIHASAAIVVVDSIRLLVCRVGPVRKPALADAPEDPVELFFAHKEGVVLYEDDLVRLNEVQRDAVVEFDAMEGTESDRRL